MWTPERCSGTAGQRTLPCVRGARGKPCACEPHAAPGSGAGVANSLHRIDVATVKAEITAAGFLLEAESEALRAPSDPRTASVFDPAIRGATDQFMLRFRKPG